MGSTWTFFLLKYESRVESTRFVALRFSMAACIPQVDGLSTNPRVRVSHYFYVFIKVVIFYHLLFVKANIVILNVLLFSIIKLLIDVLFK